MSGFNKFIQYLVLTLIILLPIRYSIERIKPFAADDRKPIWVENLKQLNRSGIPEKTLLYNFPYPIEAMFYTDCTAYSTLPSTTELETLKAKGYTIIINRNQKLTAEILNNKKFKCLYIESTVK